MSRDVRALQVGDWIRWDADSWVVQAFTGLTLHLRSRGGRGFVAAAIGEVMMAPDFAVEKSDAPDRLYGERAPHLLDEFPKNVADEARQLEADLNRMLAGYSSPVVHPNTERCSTFDGLTAKEKYALLGKQRGVTSRQVERWVAQYRKHGVVGLIDERYLALAKGLKSIHPVLRAEMQAVLEETRYASRLTKKEIRHRVEVRMDGKVDADGKPVPVPIQRTFDRYLDALTGTTGRHLTQASKRNAENRPTGLVPWLSITRPMEWVMLDTTPLDMFAMNPMAGDKDQQWQKVYLTIAVDVFSRSIVGWVFTSGEPCAEDIALLLYRIASPKVARPHWPDRGRWRYSGAPDNLVFEAAHEVEMTVDVAGSPFGRVETYVVDHGKVYISEAVLEAARILGSNLQLARVRTPTDKPQVEAAFRRIRQQFVMRLPGYKGPDIASRGTTSEVEGKAFLFLWEIEDYFAEWVACDYQNSVHEGLTFQSCPELELTPNEAYDYGLTRSGLLPVPPPPDLLIDLLPTVWRTVQHYGIEVAGVRYDDDTGVLDDYRNLQSPWVGKNRRWKVKYDRSDRSRIWFWAMDLNTGDPAVGRWMPLHYRGWKDAPLFTDEEVAYAKSIVIGRGGDTRSHEVFESTLDAVLRRIHNDQELPVAERRMMGRTYLRALAQAHDREQRAGASFQHSEPHADGTPPAAPAAPAAPAPHTHAGPASTLHAVPDSPHQPADDALVPLYDGPDEVEVDWFDADHDDIDEDLDGAENLANEPQDLP